MTRSRLTRAQRRCVDGADEQGFVRAHKRTIATLARDGVVIPMAAGTGRLVQARLPFPRGQA